jgi:hypothetical protein
MIAVLPQSLDKPAEDRKMSSSGSWQEPVFLDGDDELPQELPLMVTRHTLRSIGLSEDVLEQLSVGPTSDDQTGACNQADITPEV